MKHFPEIECETPDDPRNRAVLLCPRCGAGNLHHCSVAVYACPREDGPVTRILVEPSGDIRSQRGKARGNPSTRRHGLVIEFSCEHCAGPIILTIAQHKGSTEMAWCEGQA